MKARICQPKPQPDLRTPEEKQRDLKKAKNAFTSVLAIAGVHGDYIQNKTKRREADA